MAVKLLDLKVELVKGHLNTTCSLYIPHAMPQRTFGLSCEPFALGSCTSANVPACWKYASSLIICLRLYLPDVPFSRGDALSPSIGSVTSLARLGNLFNKNSADLAHASQWFSGRFCSNIIALIVCSAILLDTSALPASLEVSGVQCWD